MDHSRLTPAHRRPPSALRQVGQVARGVQARDLLDDRQQAPIDPRGLADRVQVCGGVLSDVLAQQHQHHDHLPVQAEFGWETDPRARANDLGHTGDQFVGLFTIKSCCKVVTNRTYSSENRGVGNSYFLKDRADVLFRHAPRSRSSGSCSKGVEMQEDSHGFESKIVKLVNVPGPDQEDLAGLLEAFAAKVREIDMDEVTDVLIEYGINEFGKRWSAKIFY